MSISGPLFFMVMAFLGSTTMAVSTLIEIKPQHDQAAPLPFEISSERGKGGDIEFTVKVTNGRWKIGDGYNTSLALVHVTEWSRGVKPVKSIPSARDGKWITCVFTVTDEELKNPDLAFYFRMPVSNVPAIDSCYARLKDYLKP